MDWEEIISYLLFFGVPCCFLVFGIIYAIFHGISAGVAYFLAPRKKYEQLSKDLENDYNNLIKQQEQKYKLSEMKLSRQYDILCKQKENEYKSLERQLHDKFDVLNKDKRLFQCVISEKKQSNPAMARVFADYEWYTANRRELYLKSKNHPAGKAAEHIKEFGQRNRELQQENKELLYQQSFWENLFPWLLEFKDVDTDKAVLLTENVSDNAEYDNAKFWLSPDEYNKLSNIEKYQLALDRYQHRKNKSSWEIGVEYERYIGYLYEKSNYKVEYRGALDGLQDMGRDLIVSKDNKKIVIQCKYWNTNKTIHEKHIFQLFGSVTLLGLQDGHSNVSGLFVTSTKLSDTAAQVAAKLNIEVKENIPMSYDYPCIKCNINQATKEKIYHLPFDQQYDKCVIKEELGEFYAFTVKEAEDKGFRRAFKWKGK